jgi:hypothetical protein
MRVPLIIVLGAVTIAACDAGSRTLGPEPLGIRAAVTENTFTPLSLLFGNRCTGEIFLVTGKIHEVRTVTVDKHGGVHQTVHVNFQSASGVSQTTGVRYRVISTQAISANNAGSLPFEQTVQVIFKLVGSGPGSNHTFRIKAHVTVDANGKVAVSFSETEVICQ